MQKFKIKFFETVEFQISGRAEIVYRNSLWKGRYNEKFHINHFKFVH